MHPRHRRRQNGRGFRAETGHVGQGCRRGARDLMTETGGGLFGGGLDFLQLRAIYLVRGRAGGRSIDFTAGGTAETFRGR